MMKNDDFKLLRGFGDGRTNGRTDICDCRVAFATEKWDLLLLLQIVGHIHQMVGHVSFGLLA